MFGIKSNKFTEASGWYAMVALILAYALVSFNVIEADGIWYQLLNLTGAVGFLIVAASKKVVQSVVVNIFWAGIGIVAIVRVFL